MNRIVSSFLIILSIFSAITYAGDNEKSLIDRYVQASMEKNPKLRLEKYEILMAEGDAYQRFTMMTRVARTAFSAKEYEKAQSYAAELINLAPQYKYDWNYGNALHDGHMVLGRIAVKNGDITEAKNHLNLAGKSPGSPQLNSLGPNMSLANDLINAGEKEVVIEYLIDCKKFWKRNDGRLDSWIASIRGGGKPYFGANLRN